MSTKKQVTLNGELRSFPAEASLLDIVHALELDDTPWRSEFLYSRAATIYGGTAEIQRNIIARRLLDLGKE